MPTAWKQLMDYSLNTLCRVGAIFAEHRCNREAC